MSSRLQCLLAVLFFVASKPGLALQAQPPHAPLNLQVYEVNLVGVSRPARDLPGKPKTPPGRALNKFFRLTLQGSTTPVADQATQSSATVAIPSSTTNNFEGIPAEANNPLLSPPDENLAVGANHIVQTVNMSFAVYNKSTGVISPGFPQPLHALYLGTGGACELQDQSDPVVRYDKQADRWILSYVTFQFSLFLITDSHMCVAVSQTGDPTGAYYLYDAGFGALLQDYPKFGVWPDGWYMSANAFLYGLTLQGSNMCAWQRDRFLVGDKTGKVICVSTGSAYAGLLPSHWDGATPPPAGSPNYYVGLYSTAQLMMFRLKPNYITPSATQTTGPFYITVSSFNLPCGGGDCIPQKDTSQLLGSLGDRAMYRLPYRNFGTYESLVVNHSVSANGTVGPRWYEIRDPGGTPTVYQQGTYVPDADYRWMGSMAMDKSGNIAIGYSKSGLGTYPGIFYTGREAGDPLGTLGAEQMIWAGSGSQLPGDDGSNRWGDYSSIETDPVDDCTFWYTSEYLPASGTFNWRTRIASFKFTSCGAAKTNTTTTIASHTPSTTVTGQSYSVSVTVSPSAGSGTPSGNVTVNDGVGASCPITLAGGGGSCSLTATTAVNRTLTATYDGDATFNGSTSTPVTHNVNAASTTTTITGDSPDPSTTGQAYNVTFTVAVNSPGSGAPTGNVIVSDGTGASCTAPVSAGTCTITSTTSGAKTLTATYAGNSDFIGSSGTAAHTVNPPAGTPPSAPTNLMATPVYGTQGKKVVLKEIDLSWQDNADNEDRFVIERWKATGKGPNRTCALEVTFTAPGRSGTGTTTFIDTSASTSTCKYRVAAQNSAGTSAFAETNVSP